MSDDDFELDYSHDNPTDIRGKTQVPREKFDAPREEKGKKVYASKFFIPDDTPDDNAKKLKNRLDQSFRGFSKKQTPEWKFTARVKLENEVSGVRIWRIE